MDRVTCSHGEKLKGKVLRVSATCNNWVRKITGARKADRKEE